MSRSTCSCDHPHLFQCESEGVEGVVRAGLHGAFGDAEAARCLGDRTALEVGLLEHRTVLG